MNNTERESAITLRILDTIHIRSDVTQRGLATGLGIALGLTNSYLKRCVRKGLIKIQQVPPNRYLYYLTPEGFAEKSRLTVRYLGSTFALYRKASADYAVLFERCRRECWTSVVLCGRSELAEIAMLRAQEHGIAVTSIFERNAASGASYLGYRVLDAHYDLESSHALILTALTDPGQVYQDLQQLRAHARILVPAFLSFVTTGDRVGNK